MIQYYKKSIVIMAVLLFSSCSVLRGCKEEKKKNENVNEIGLNTKERLDEITKLQNSIEENLKILSDKTKNLIDEGTKKRVERIINDYKKYLKDYKLVHLTLVALEKDINLSPSDVSKSTEFKGKSSKLLADYKRIYEEIKADNRNTSTNSFSFQNNCFWASGKYLITDIDQDSLKSNINTLMKQVESIENKKEIIISITVESSADWRPSPYDRNIEYNEAISYLKSKKVKVINTAFYEDQNNSKLSLLRGYSIIKEILEKMACNDCSFDLNLNNLGNKLNRENKDTDINNLYKYRYVKIECNTSPNHD